MLSQPAYFDSRVIIIMTFLLCFHTEHQRFAHLPLRDECITAGYSVEIFKEYSLN